MTLWKLLFAGVAFAVDLEDQDIQELQKQAEQAMQSLQNIPGLQPGGVGAHPQLDQIRVRLIQLATNQNFLNAVQKLWNHPNRATCLYLEGGAIIVIMIFKAWRQSRHTSWIGKLFVSLYCFVIFWGVVSFAIPYYCYGDSYLTVLKGLKTVVIPAK
jgi:hypothetical protein